MVKVKNWIEFNEKILSPTRNIDDIFNHIKTMPKKYKLKTKNSYYAQQKLYDNGIDTALNASMITLFYLKYLKNHNKSTTILPIPSLLDENVYNKINEFIRMSEHSDYNDSERDETVSLLKMSEKSKNALKVHLFRMQCFQTMNLLLYEDFFGIKFKYDIRKMIENIIIPSDEKSFLELVYAWNYKESEISLVMFFSDSEPIIRAIEFYN